MNDKARKVPSSLPQASRNEIGAIGEAAAKNYLEQQGCRIVERNWRCRSGEIDLVVVPPEPAYTLVFVEVRTRRASGRFGTAAESVDYRKQRQVRAVAQVYLHQHGGADQNLRFDVVAVTVDRQLQIKELEWIQGAF
ncbi:YraN family protein [Paenibacillus pinihumi]|uniref:YraN family protein n=1 Tax=Paenibacillus pinihumi TaxID=669462 RepID=UPI0003F7F05B|nr:YraN family protein [Paenibacillus pinihumi]